jgi:hypothetical protein
MRKRALLMILGLVAAVSAGVPGHAASAADVSGATHQLRTLDRVSAAPQRWTGVSARDVAPRGAVDGCSWLYAHRSAGSIRSRDVQVGTWRPAAEEGVGS